MPRVAVKRWVFTGSFLECCNLFERQKVKRRIAQGCSEAYGLRSNRTNTLQKRPEQCSNIVALKCTPPKGYFSFLLFFLSRFLLHLNPLLITMGFRLIFLLLGALPAASANGTHERLKRERYAMDGDCGNGIQWMVTTGTAMDGGHGNGNDGGHGNGSLLPQNFF